MIVIDQSSSFYQDEVGALLNFRRYGYHVEREFLDHQLCDELIIASKKLGNAKDGEYRPTLNPHLESSEFLKIMRDTRLIAIIEKIVGGKISGLQTQFFFGMPGTKGFSVHQDNFFVEAKDPDAFVSTWLALTDVNKENGTIFIYPGAHLEGLLPTQKLAPKVLIGQEQNASNEECIVPEKYKAYPVEVPRGTLLFLHSLLPHGSFDNQSKNSWRYVMLNNYIKQQTPFRPGNRAKRKEIPLYDVVK
jgi:ectoine hydroxylase-related dioxygenase (phytanoyl-CoA dioxygenase family)